MNTPTADEIRDQVQAHYSQIAAFTPTAATVSCCETGASDACCDYSADTSWLPGDVTNLSLGCGDPITLADLKAGQVVLDLGSGGGIDCFLAAERVGPAGRVIGVDMTPTMLERAEHHKAQLGAANVEFRQGLIEALPVDANSVDVIISNCVINLSPDKTAVFHEAYRALKPGGRLAVSDMVTQGHFTPQERADMSAWAGCITGAEDVADYVAAMVAAGFVDISVRDKGAPAIELAHSLSLDGPARLFSARITARKQARA